MLAGFAAVVPPKTPSGAISVAVGSAADYSVLLPVWVVLSQCLFLGICWFCYGVL
ncbi:hypothetical protein A2U01_0069789, partial [Trifolium medium]|nr:hypothetical protein [Trifolium medium]